MKEFEMGDSLEINLLAGEAYQVFVKSNENYVNLSDKGTGSIQALQLILKLATMK